MPTWTQTDPAPPAPEEVAAAIAAERAELEPYLAPLSDYDEINTRATYPAAARAELEERLTEKRYENARFARRQATDPTLLAIRASHNRGCHVCGGSSTGASWEDGRCGACQRVDTFIRAEAEGSEVMSDGRTRREIVAARIAEGLS